MNQSIVNTIDSFVKSKNQNPRQTPAMKSLKPLRSKYIMGGTERNVRPYIAPPLIPIQSKKHYILLL